MHAETASLCIRPLLVRALYLSVTEWLLLVRPRQQQHLKFLLWGRTNRVTGLRYFFVDKRIGSSVPPVF